MDEARGSIDHVPGERAPTEAILQRTLEQVEQAKQEWEATVDSLPELICLLDDQGRVLRANRTLERWNLGSVTEIKGQAIQGLFHPGWADFWQGAWMELSQGRTVERELEDERLQRHLHVQLRPIAASTSRRGRAAESFAVVAISDVSERVRMEQELGGYRDRLEELVEQRTAELTAAVTEARRLGEQLQRANDELAREIVERVRAERALRQSEVRFRNIFENTTIGLYQTAPDGRILLANPALVRMLGYSSFEELAQRNLAESVYEPDYPRSLFKERLESEEQVVGLESTWVCHDGSRLFVRESARVVRDGAGNTLYYEGSLEDITERVQAEDQLRRRNEELLALNIIATTIGRSLDLDHILNATLDRVLEVIAIDAGWVQLLDEDPGVLSLVAHRGFSAAMVQETQRIELGHSMTGRVAQSGQPIVVDKVSDDPRFSIEAGRREALYAFAGVPIQTKDKVLGVLGVFSRSPRALDSREVQFLTAVGHQVGLAIENVRLVEEAAEIEIMRELDRLRSELIANVSHELRTPLGLIKVFCTSLLREHASFDRETWMKFLRGIEEETDKLEEIVGHLLDLSHIESGRLFLDRRPTDLGELARKTMQVMEIQLVRHRLVYELPCDPLVATVSAKRIEQVLRNLLSNAINYSPAGGRITVRGYRDRDEIVICVSDEGIGIPPQEQQKIFERFYRVENEVTRSLRGGGLGLSVCRGVVEAHGGRIWVESSPGVGSTFYFALPVGAHPEHDRTDGEGWIRNLGSGLCGGGSA